MRTSMTITKAASAIIGTAGTLLATAPLPALAQNSSLAPPFQAETPVPASPGTAEVPLTPVSYLFGPHDVINIAVVGRSDFNQQVLVQDDGTIALALIGQLTVTNLTALQLKSVIEARLRSGGYFVKPEVTVTLANATSQYAVVLGNIGNPGLASLDRPYHLSELIARSGGVRAGSDIVTVTMPGSGSREFSLRAIATNESPDPMVAPGTKVYVQPAQMYYIYGQIGSPGTFPLERDMSVRNAIARAGGMTTLGSTKKITLYRGDKTIKHVDLNAKLLPGDTLSVGERFF